MRIADVQLTFPAILIALLVNGVAKSVFGNRLDAMSTLAVLVVAIGLVVYFQVSTPIFLTPDNLRNIAQATAPTAIVAGSIELMAAPSVATRLPTMRSVGSSSRTTTITLYGAHSA